MNLAQRPEDLAREVCTPAQFEAWDLIESHGVSQRRAAELVGVSRETIRDRLAAARANIGLRQRAEFASMSPPRSQNLPPATGTMTSLAVGLLIQRDGARCYLCRRDFGHEMLQIEHIIPTSAGGTDMPENLALACGPCNIRKGPKFVAFLVQSGRPVYYQP